ncbi:hypothetical protein J2Z19_003403 [Ensifer adhaerens]|uniref:Uncharacterized protein n=1 Tax=Ensifer adhaerens TaxID=106592 RepID=A0ACC5SY88_ENSAD|nr:hypothetical protein [Ensifer adhaerens]
MIEQASSPFLIPVLVTGIQQRHVRAAQDQNRTGVGAVKKSAPTGLPTQAGWIPLTSTGMRALAASSQTASDPAPGAPAAIDMRECEAA